MSEASGLRGSLGKCEIGASLSTRRTPRSMPQLCLKTMSDASGLRGSNLGKCAIGDGRVQGFLEHGFERMALSALPSCEDQCRYLRRNKPDRAARQRQGRSAKPPALEVREREQTCTQ